MRYLQQTKAEEKVNLDVKDKKILACLSHDARLPLTKIAKEVGLSRDSVHYRIEQLTKHGVIQGYRTVINIGKFGYDAYHIFLRLNQASKTTEEELVNIFQHYAFARAVITFRGKYDVELAVVAKSNKEFDAILDKVLHDCGKNVQEYDVLITTGSYVAHVLPSSFHPAPPFVAQKEETMQSDEKDVAILRVLANDALMPIYTIAQNVKLSDDAVTHRIKRMRASGAIVKFVPVINFANLRYSVYAVLVRTNGLSKPQAQQLQELLQQDPHVLWAIKCVGRYNLLTYICTKSTEELNDTISSLRAHFPENILDYEVLIAYEEYKYTYFPEYALL